MVRNVRDKFPPAMILEDHFFPPVGGRTITNPRFADNIDGLTGEEEELAKSVERLKKVSTAYDMEIKCLEDQVGDKQHQWH